MILCVQHKHHSVGIDILGHVAVNSLLMYARMNQQKHIEEDITIMLKQKIFGNLFMVETDFRGGTKNPTLSIYTNYIKECITCI